jgi:hypothetical protein
LERLQMFWLETEMEWCYSIDMIRRNAWGQWVDSRSDLSMRSISVTVNQALRIRE